MKGVPAIVLLGLCMVSGKDVCKSIVPIPQVCTNASGIPFNIKVCFWRSETSFLIYGLTGLRLQYIVSKTITCVFHSFLQASSGWVIAANLSNTERYVRYESVHTPYFNYTYKNVT